jgi:hypothetical protein
MAHTGDSANISWYAERHQGDRDYVYAEVLRNDFVGVFGVNLRRRTIPEYHFRLKRVTEGGNLDAGTFTYNPTRKPNPLVLGNRTVTRLVREHLDPVTNPSHGVEGQRS